MRDRLLKVLKGQGCSRIFHYEGQVLGQNVRTCHRILSQLLALLEGDPSEHLCRWVCSRSLLHSFARGGRTAAPRRVLSLDAALRASAPRYYCCLDMLDLLACWAAHSHHLGRRRHRHRRLTLQRARLPVALAPIQGRGRLA